MSDSDRGERSAYLRGDFFAITILIVYLLVFALAFYSGKQEERRTYEPHQHAVSAANGAEKACSGREGSALTECVIEQIATAEETSRAEQDLQAQQHMALWALLMVLVSAATVGATVWALFYVKKTLDETSRMSDITAGMAKEAVDATKAMVAQNTLTEAGNRAWLSIDLVDFGPVSYSETGEYRVSFELAVVNHGNMPALAVSCHAELNHGIDGKIDIPGFVERAGKTKEFMVKAVAPKQSVRDSLGNVLLDCTGLDDGGLWPDHTIPQLLIGVTYIYPSSPQVCSTILVVYPGLVLSRRDAPTKIFPEAHVTKTLMA